MLCIPESRIKALFLFQCEFIVAAIEFLTSQSLEISGEAK